MIRPGGARAATGRDLCFAAALLPVVPAAVSIAAILEPWSWSELSVGLVRALTPDALLYSAVCLVIASPLAGVLVGPSRRDAVSRHGSPIAHAVLPLLAATLAFGLVSAALTFARLGLSLETATFVATSHAVLASVALALGALGAACRGFFRDQLDAAASSLVIATVAGGGIFVAGAPVGEIPATLRNAALLASPLMTMASAAHVDLVRTDILYQISPLAHVQVDYPSWAALCGWYLSAGFVGFLGLAWSNRIGRRRALLGTHITVTGR